MTCHRVFVVAAFVGAALGAALFVSPAAYAESSLFPPGALGPIGNPANVQDVDASPFFEYKQADYLYNVVDSGNNVIGQFSDTHSFFESPYQPFGVWYSETKDVISDSTVAGLANGATQDDAAWQALGLTGFQVLASSHYVNNPGVETEYLFQIPLIFANDYVSNASGTSDVVGLFGQSFTLFDFPAPAAAGAVDTDWLTDLAALFGSGLLS